MTRKIQCGKINDFRSLCHWLARVCARMISVDTKPFRFWALPIKILHFSEFVVEPSPNFLDTENVVEFILCLQYATHIKQKDPHTHTDRHAIPSLLTYLLASQLTTPNTFIIFRPQIHQNVSPYFLGYEIWYSHLESVRQTFIAYFHWQTMSLLYCILRGLSIPTVRVCVFAFSIHFVCVLVCLCRYIVRIAHQMCAHKMWNKSHKNTRANISCER